MISLFKSFFNLNVVNELENPKIQNPNPSKHNTPYRSIVAVGGQNESSIIDSVEVYDPCTNAWTVRTPLPQPVRCMTSVAYKGSLYVFGGETEKEITRAAYR